MEVTLSFTSSIQTNFKSYLNNNRIDIDSLFDKWRIDERIQGVSLQQYKCIDNIVNFMYTQIQQVEANFNTNWDISITQATKPISYSVLNAQGNINAPFILTIDTDTITR